MQLSSHALVHVEDSAVWYMTRLLVTSTPKHVIFSGGSGCRNSARLCHRLVRVALRWTIVLLRLSLKARANKVTNECSCCAVSQSMCAEDADSQVACRQGYTLSSLSSAVLGCRCCEHAA